MGVRAFLATLIGVALVAVGCGGGDNNESAATEQAAVSAAPAGSEPAATPVASAPASAVAPSTASGPASPPSGTGSCSVAIEGAISRTWTSNASGFQAFVYGGWLANPSPEDAEAFYLNCYDEDFNIVGFFNLPGKTIPMEPATYEVGASDTTAELGSDIALLFDPSMLWDSTSGMFVITEFDDSHIAGTFSLTIEDTSDSTRTATVTGDFAHSR